jgi:aconitase A
MPRRHDESRHHERCHRHRKDGKPVYLKDIWPTNKEVADVVMKCVTQEMFKSRYADVFKGEKAVAEIPVGKGKTYGWDGKAPMCKTRLISSA